MLVSKRQAASRPLGGIYTVHSVSSASTSYRYTSIDLNSHLKTETEMSVWSRSSLNSQILVRNLNNTFNFNSYAFDNISSAFCSLLTYTHAHPSGSTVSRVE